MTFANCGFLVAKPNLRDEVVTHLTRFSSELSDAGCLLYEVGVNDDEVDKVFVAELWPSAKTHQSSLQLDSVKAAIAEVVPKLTGEFPHPVQNSFSPSEIQRTLTGFEPPARR